MKKLKLLLIAAAAMLGLNASAQLTNGTVYWIQDAATGEFISQGANWGTQATVQDVGGVGFEAVYAAEGVYQLKNIMWNKVNNANLGLNIVEHDGYCDQAASEIKLSPSGDGYLLSAVKDNNTRYICNNQTANGYGVKGIGFTTNVDEATVWKFLTKEGYDAAIQAYKNSKAASFATLLNYSVTTVSDLEAIITDENQFISKDYTSSITNAALNAGNTNGWTAVKPNQRDQKFSSENGTMAEVWNGCVVASQTVSGLPKGLYKVTFVGTFRPKGNSASEKLTSEQTSSPAYVFANDAKEEFIHWIDVEAKANNRTQIKDNAAAYTSSFYTYVTDGSLNLGVKQDTWYNGEMWCPFGYFTLTYYTDKVSDEDATDILDRANSIKDSKMGNPVKSALTSAISTFNGNKTIANYNALNTAITNANASIASYEALLAAITNANTIYTTVFEASTAMYNDAVTTAQGVYDAAVVDDVAGAISNLTIGIHNAYENDYSVFANDYPYDYSTLLNQDMTKWASTNYVTMTANEHWNGKSGQTYYEQSGEEWGQNSWSHAATETVTLPKGKYVMSITARASAAVVSTMTVKVGDGNPVTVALPNKGASGYGITTDGVGSYSSSETYAKGGEGYGWEYRYIAFEVTADDTPVTISFSSSVEGATQNWVSLANPLLKGNVNPNQIKVNQIKSLVETLTGYENQITAGTYATFADHITAGNSATVDSENLDEIITNLQADIQTAKAEKDLFAKIEEALANVPEGKMNAQVQADLASAKAAAMSNELTAENLQTVLTNLNNAIAAANNSIAAYAHLTAVVNKVQAAAVAAQQNGATVTNEQQAALGLLYADYNNGKIADNDVMAKVAEGYDMIIPIIKSQTAASADFTLAIRNQSFEYGNMTGWTVTNSNDTGVRENSNATYTTSGVDGFYLFNTWSQGVPVTQTVEGLPNGEYTLTALVASDGGTIYLLANGEHNEGTFRTDKTIGIDASITFLVKDGVATIGAVGGDGEGDYIEAGHWWYKADNFRLVKNRDLNPGEGIVVATADDLAALNSAIETAEAKKLGFQKDEYAPYNNVDALKALKDAKAIDQQYEYLKQEDVQAATAALTGATWTKNDAEVNAVYDGTFAAATNNGAPAGWRMSNNTLGGNYHSRAFVGDERLSEFNETNSGLFLRFDGTNSNRGSMYFYGDTEGYTMPLAEGSIYRLTVDFAGWGYTGKPLRLNVTGPEGFTAVSQEYNTNVDADNGVDAPQQFNIVFTATVAGNYVISFQTPGSDSNKHNVIVSNIVLMTAQPVDITIKEDETYVPKAEYANVTFNRTTVAGWNGMVLPFDVDEQSMTVVKTMLNVKENRVMNFAGVTYDPAKGVTLNFTPATEVKAGRPFMVYLNNAGNSYSTTVSYGGMTRENPVMLSANALEDVTFTAENNENIKYTFKGTYAATTDLTNVDFALINGKKFYYHTAASGLPSSAKAFRAYFVNESTDPEGARLTFNFGDDVVTGISEIETTPANSEAIYNMGGQRVTKAQKGLYIQNGKKVVVK